MIIDEYCGNIIDTLSRIRDTQKDKIEAVAARAADVIRGDGIIYIFGCGHSSLIAADCLFRAGGLACVSAVFDNDLMLHDGAAKSSAFEKIEGLAKHIFKRYCITKNDMLIVVSTSGINAVPVEMALAARESGVYAACITSSAYFGSAPRHSSGKLLYQCADTYIDNCVPKGDATVQIGTLRAKMGSVSTAASSYIINSVLMEAAALSEKDGTEVPVYLSGNIEGGAQFNASLIERYQSRVKNL